MWRCSIAWLQVLVPAGLCGGSRGLSVHIRPFHFLTACGSQADLCAPPDTGRPRSTCPVGEWLSALHCGGLGWSDSVLFSCAYPFPRHWVLSMFLRPCWLVLFSAYRLYTVVPRLVKFVDVLTNWYVRMNRRRLKVSLGLLLGNKKCRKNDSGGEMSIAKRKRDIFKCFPFLKLPSSFLCPSCINCIYCHLMEGDL